MDLVEILKRPEGKTLEFKRDLSSPDGVLRAVVAFANTAGGTLLLGVEDKSRRVRGVGDALAMEERLANLISDRIAPGSFPRSKSCPGAAHRFWRFRSIRARADPITWRARGWLEAPMSGSVLPTPS